MLNIEVAFATPILQKIIRLELADNGSIDDAIIKSELSIFFPDYDLLALPVGVFGKRIYDKNSYQLQDGDRLEIYRPLMTSPNQKRLDRAAAK